MYTTGSPPVERNWLESYSAHSEAASFRPARRGRLRPRPVCRVAHYKHVFYPQRLDYVETHGEATFRGLAKYAFKSIAIYFTCMCQVHPP